ncbi:uncharacterized protein LOC135143578 isoform X1 [Zophobas morio]|uniref:uncharacterized protein LOC135143578 isoform X1 n=1 Tax=Zophobas morio TaxID=2755281 RepID=UPI0030828268
MISSLSDIKLKVQRLSAQATLPVRATEFSAGYDLFSSSDIVVPAKGKELIKTDIAIAIPPNCYGRIAPRSGLAWKLSVDVGGGVVDADYRGPLGVILFNHGEKDFSIKRGDRVAQLILEKIITPTVEEVSELEPTARGSGGFGSTGMKDLHL